MTPASRQPPSRPPLVRRAMGAIRAGMARNPALAPILANASWLYGDNLIRMVLGLLVGILVAPYLGPEGYGALNFALALVALVAAASPLGLRNLVVRDIIGQPDRAGAILGTTAVLQAAGGLIGYGLLLGLAALLRSDDPLARATIAILGTQILFRATDGIEYWFSAHNRSGRAVLAMTGARILLALVKLGLVVVQAPFIAFAWAWAADGAAAALALGFALYRYGPRQAWRVEPGRAIALLRECWPLILSGIAAIIYLKIDQIMLGWMMGDHAVGIYAVAVRMSESWYFLGTAIVTSAFPAMVRARGASAAAFESFMRTLYDVLAVLAMAFSLILTLLANDLVRLLFGDAFASAGPVLTIHAWASVFVFLGVASGRWLILERRLTISMYRTVAGAVVNVVLNLILIPRHGPIGAAWATVIAYGVSGFACDALHPATRPTLVMKLRAIALCRFLGILARAVRRVLRALR